MKEKGLLVAFLLVFIFSLSLIASETPKQLEQISKAYSCLADKVDSQKCSSFTTAQKVFTLLSLGDCEQELLASAKTSSGLSNSLGSSSDVYCFSSTNSGGCDIKSTALAILALNEKGYTDEAQRAGEWLLAQTTVQSDMDWFLQIESTNPTTCTITYSGVGYPISIGSDKKINQPAGSCLTLSSGNYWLKISPSCYDKEFTISCNESFLTNLLYNAPNSDTIYVSDTTHLAPSSKETTEKITSLCLKSGTSCNYEATLWSAFALNLLGYPPKEFLPYLVSNEDGNSKLMPEAFLSNLIDESYTNQLLSTPPFRPQGKIIKEGYWQAQGSSDKFYDTALAMFFLRNSNYEQKDKAINYLLKDGIAGSNGCWNSIEDTGFLLYSIWPDQNPNYQCRNDSMCDAGQVCNMNNRTCVEGCKTSLTCPSGQFCNQNKTCEQGCYNNSGCSAGSVCSITNHTCVTCVLDADCNNASQKCTADNECIPKTWECETDSNCVNSNEPVCSSNHTCVSCEYDSSCSSSGKVCDISSNTCEQCVYDVDCGNSTKECKNNICVNKPECSKDSDCSVFGSGMRCVTGLGFGYCVSDVKECDSTNKCDAGYDCKNGECIAVQECDNQTKCDTGYRCDINNKCVLIPDDTTTQKEDCLTKKYFCRGRDACLKDDGTVLDNLYDCNTPYYCCDTPEKQKTCADQSGDVCSTTQNCDGGKTIFDASDLKSGEICCIGGSCKNINTGGISDCEFYGGTCRSSCNNDEISNSDACTNSGETCCVSSGSPSGKCTSNSDCASGETCGSNGTCTTSTTSYLWLWILLGLIVLALLGILFRNQLRVFFMKMKSSFGGSKPRQPSPGFPYSPSPSGISTPSSRRMIPPPQNTPIRRPMPPKNSKSDIDDVLKKLKDMGK